MKKILITISIFLLSILNVKANTLTNMEVNITLEEDATAHITEVWTMKNKKDTEVYKKMYNLGNSEISNFKVSDLKQEYTFKDNWNINDSFENKKYKNGYNYVTKGTELCWGISDYGKNTYTISYDVSNYIFNVEDAQVLYWKVIDGMSIMEDMDYNITISGPKEYENTLDVWGFGSKAYVRVENGKIIAYNEEKSQMNYESDYLVILVKYPLGTFNTTNTYSEYQTWDDVYNKAKENSYNYEWNIEKEEDENDTLFNVIMIVSSWIIFILIYVITDYQHFKLKDKTKYKFLDIRQCLNKNNVEYYRDIPYKDDITRSYFIFKAYKIKIKDTNFFSAILLKWLYEDKISIIEQENKNNKEILSIKLNNKSKFNSLSESYLFNALVNNSGNDLIVTKKVMKKENVKRKIYNWFKYTESYGRNLYMKENLIKLKNHIYYIDNKLDEEAIKLVGLKKYLNDFTLMNEKETIEVKLWKEYLVYAQMFGIADKVAKQLKELYPEIYKEVELDYSTVLLISNISNDLVNSANRAHFHDSINSRSGSSGSDYSSGGGGYSSGGGGGGSFGGGGGGTR